MDVFELTGQHVFLFVIGIFNILLAWAISSLTYKNRDVEGRLRLCELTLAKHYSGEEVRLEINSALKPIARQLDEQRSDLRTINGMLMQIVGGQGHPPSSSSGHS